MRSTPNTPADAVSATLVKVMREPLFHFVLLAGVLFAVAALFRPGDDVLEISRQELDWRVLRLEMEQGTPLSDEERRAVEESYIDERVLVREAQAMGLDADERIDDILVQKMLHILSGDVIQPTDAELSTYYEANRERYATESAVTVDELVLPIDAPLPEELMAGAAPEELPEEARVSHRVVERVTRRELGQIYGGEAAELAFGAETGLWVSAARSVRGQFWLRVRERFDRAIPALAGVRDVVRLDWIADQEDLRLLARVNELRSHYTVVVEGRQDEGGR